MKLNHSGRPMTLNEHIFNWFKERDSDEMAKCLAAYTDSDSPSDPYGDFDIVNNTPRKS